MPKGKKTCPECGIESGVRTSTCGCGHRFSFKQPSVDQSQKAIHTANTGVNIGANTAVKVEQTIVERPAQSPRLFSSISCPLVQTPAGRCPTKPQGFIKKDWPDGPATTEAVESWALKVFSSGNYLPDAVIYWIHEFWDMNLNYGEEYKRVKSIVLRTLCGSQQE